MTGSPATITVPLWVATVLLALPSDQRETPNHMPQANIGAPMAISDRGDVEIAQVVVVHEPPPVPRSAAAGDFHLSGVMLACPSEAAVPLMKRGMSWMFVPRALSQGIMLEINELVLAGRIKSVIGQVIGSDALPEALEALGQRQTVGLTIVRLWWGRVAACFAATGHPGADVP